MRYENLIRELDKYEDCIDCEVFIEGEVLVIVSQGIKIDQIKEDEIDKFMKVFKEHETEDLIALSKIKKEEK